MKVYEFYIDSSSWAKTFDDLTSSFYIIGSKFVRVIDKGSVYREFEKDGITPHSKAGLLVTGSAVYGISLNEITHWMQLLVDDNATPPIITSIEAMIDTLKDTGSIITYDDELHTEAPIETPKGFTLEQVLEVRRKQIDGTLREIEPIR